MESALLAARLVFAGFYGWVFAFFHGVCDDGDYYDYDCDDGDYEYD